MTESTADQDQHMLTNLRLAKALAKDWRRQSGEEFGSKGGGRENCAEYVRHSSHDCDPPLNSRVEHLPRGHCRCEQVGPEREEQVEPREKEALRREHQLR
jgi:hypothetical protein